MYWTFLFPRKKKLLVIAVYRKSQLNVTPFQICCLILTLVDRDDMICSGLPSKFPRAHRNSLSGIEYK